MTTPNASGLTPHELVRLLTVHRRSWLLPTVVCAMLALVYALLMSRYWEASQALVVRSEASTSSATEPGKFADLFAMRTFQETILELAKSQQVIATTIQAVEQAETGRPPSLPSAEAIDKFRKRLSMTPPGGAEFGKTEIFYFGVKDTDRERAIRLVAELCKQIDVRLRDLRDEQSQSLVVELEQQVALAGASHETESHRLAEFEAEVGPDLGELRMLNASQSGQSDLRQHAVALEIASRDAQVQLRASEQLLVVLRAAQHDPEQLVAMPSSLLTSQPTLRRLKDGLVDAQLRAARLAGTRTDLHPQVQAAVDAIEHIRGDLHQELQVAIRGVEIEIQLGRHRSTELKTQHTAVQQRLSRLAQLRAGYADRVSSVENSRTVLDQARKQLGEVRAAQAAARNVSLVTPIDQPETGLYPAGPGRTTVLLVGTLGGLVLGLGWVFLAVVPGPQTATPMPPAPVAKTPVPVSPSVAARIAEIVSPTPANLTSPTEKNGTGKSTLSR